MSPLINLAIKMLVNTAKNINNTHLMYSYVHSYCLKHSFNGKAHGTRVPGQYLHGPNHILGNTNITLTLVSFMVYAWHFDPPMQ